MSTFTNAEQVCVAWNMDLATFENSNEFNAIFELQCEHVFFKRYQYVQYLFFFQN